MLADRQGQAALELHCSSSDRPGVRHFLSPAHSGADYQDISVLLMLLCLFPCQRSDSKGGSGDDLILSQLGREQSHSPFLFYYYKLTQFVLPVCFFGLCVNSANIAAHLQSHCTMGSSLIRSGLCPGKMFCSRKD